MKRKAYLTIITVVLLAALSIPAAFAAQNNIVSFAAPDKKNEINLTDVQKGELKQLYNQMFEIKKQIVQKYVDFGAISKEQGDKRIKRLEEKQKTMEQNGFTPGHKKGFGRPHKNKEEKD